MTVYLKKIKSIEGCNNEVNFILFQIKISINKQM